MGNPGINNLPPESGRIILNDGTIINIADVLKAVYDAENGALNVIAEFEPTNINISDVSLKDGSSPNKAVINALGELSTAVADGASVTMGTTTDIPITTTTDPSTVIAALKGIFAKLGEVKTQLSSISGEVIVSSSALPTGAATETTLQAIQTLVTAIKSTDGIKKIIDSVKVNADSLPLPAGAATADKQDDIVTELESILSQLQSSLTVSVTGTASVSVTNPVEIKNDTGDPITTKLIDGANTLSINSYGEGKTIDSNLFLEISRGRMPGMKWVNVFGCNDSVTTTEVEIWDGATAYNYLNAASILQISSASANDTAAGTGARVLTIYGLDGSYNEISESIVLNGTTNVPTVNSYLRVHRMEVTSAGSVGHNQGIISAKVSTTAYAQIVVGHNKTCQGLYTIPAGKTGYLYTVQFNTGVNSDLETTIKTRQFGKVFLSNAEQFIYANTGKLEAVCPFPLPEKTDVAMTALTSGGTKKINGYVGLLLIDN